ncbi:LLM class flavin-dependent oxidoreductase, partial [Streptomyces sp. NPDC059744]|uniref:LLM class flavin-dependent oxidoreductase n=1 Tax=Streptomyces sp. NPDC059744 TaxID=3346929 RepID=UPI00365F0CA8
MSSSPSSLSSSLHLAVALDGAGWHPAAWREPVARPGDLLTAEYWADIVTEAEHGLLDFVTIEDALGLQSSRFTEPDSRTDQVRGRLDAVLIAARVAPLTRHVGLIPTVVTTHTEPFHISKAIATLDYVSTGRAGLRVQVSGRQNEAAHFGRRTIPRIRFGEAYAPEIQEVITELFEEAGDYVEVVRRLWDSWEDDAEIRDVATGRFVDRDKLHYVDFEGATFTVRGPAIVPRPPQGHPVTVIDGTGGPSQEAAARHADVVLVRAPAPEQAAGIRADVRRRAAAYGRDPDTLRVLVALTVDLGDAETAPEPGLESGPPLAAGGSYYRGGPVDLAELIARWHR